MRSRKTRYPEDNRNNKKVRLMVYFNSTNNFWQLYDIKKD